MIVIDKTPDASLDYTIDFRPWLKPGRILSNVTASYALGIVAARPLTFDDITATVWIAGGTVGERNEVVIHFVDDDSREDDLSIFFDIVERQ